MSKYIFAAFLTTVLGAQTTVESVPFRAILSPQNEVPALNVDASGVATVWLHVIKDASGQIVSGSADFVVNYRFAAGVTLTGLHIHRGAAGVNGPVTINSGLASTPDTTGRAGVNLQGQIRADNAAALSTANDMLTDPAGFYVNLHTTDFPGGVIRGQLERAQMKVLLGQMRPENEVPPVQNPDASAIGAVRLLYTTRPDGSLTTASATFDVSYTGISGDGLRFTGLHIHRGGAGVNGPVTIDSSLPGGTNGPLVASTGTGTVSFTNEVSLTNVAAVSTFYDLLGDPSGHYINIHTNVNPGGVVRGQLRNTDQLSLMMEMSPLNEVPPLSSLDASASARFDIWTLRDMSDAVVAATVAFDVNHRFPGEATFTGLHIHNGVSGMNGPVTIDSGIRTGATVASPAGFGNIYRTAVVSSTAGLATLNTMLTRPEATYINLHTMVNPGGAVRAQSAGEGGPPSVEAVISAVSDPTYRETAPGGLISIYGRNLARISSTGGGGATSAAPGTLNGTRVIVGNNGAAVISVSPRVVVAQVPAEASMGMNPLYVISATGTSNTVMVPVKSYAPGVFVDANLAQGNRAIAYKAADLSFVTMSNPAAAGDDVLIPAVGLGPVVPPIQTGLPGNSGAPLVTPQVMIGGRPSTRVSAMSVSMMVGVYWVTARVPEGVAAGMQPLVVSANNQNSNPTLIAIR